MSIKCGNCKEYHESTQAVRDCFAYNKTSANIARHMPMGAPVQEELPLEDKWAQVMRDINHEIANHNYFHNIGRTASEKQVDFAESLMARRAHDLDRHLVFPNGANQNTWLRSLPAGAISILIGELKNAPLKEGQRPSPGHDNQQDVDQIPAGRYAVVDQDGKSVKFYKVDRPTEGRWAGYTFVKVQAGDEYHRVPAQRAILRRIAEQGAEECMLRYGRELGHCGHCGRTLTNDESRAVGIGPVCREKVNF